MNTENCCLLFSGGRDSTASVIELLKKFRKITLITVLADHLYGINMVEKRIDEISGILPPQTKWYKVWQPAFPFEEVLFSRTCLPCQRAYLASGILITLKEKFTHLAMGYAGYQNTWPEQTPIAVEKLTQFLRKINISLELPVYNIKSKHEVIEKLYTYGLDSDSLEQKCVRQVFNIKLPEAFLDEETTKWINSLEMIINHKDDVQLNFEIKVLN